jgi:ADP-L-glycero-D-manno-heptose 6-epimerase
MIIVTGGAGFIGSNLVRALNRAGHEDIVVVDNLTNADKCRNLNRCRFIDLIDKRDFLSRLPTFRGVRAVMHQGACSSTTEKDGRYLLENNIDYSKRLLAWTQEINAAFIYASSASVYGNGDDGFLDDRPACEYPLNGYAFSKWVFDAHVRRLASGFRAQVVGLRWFNVYGPHEHHKGGQCSPMLHFHRQLTSDGKLKLFAGSDGFHRDFVHVEDCCAVAMHFLVNPHVSGIYNCGTGTARSFAEVAQLMVARYPGASIDEVPFPEQFKGKYQAYTCAELTRLRAAGYSKPFLPLEQGLASYVDLLRSPNAGYLPA